MKSRLAAALALGAFAAMAGSDPVAGQWTGAGGDVYWVTSDNWADGVIPGRYTTTDSGSVVTNGTYGCTARFGALADASKSRIVSMGAMSSASRLVTVSNVVIAAGAPHYSFQQSANAASIAYDDPFLRVEEGGGVTVESGNENGATFWIRLAFGDRLNSGHSFAFRNDGTGVLALRSLGSPIKAVDASSWFSFNVYYRGSGTILLFGNHIQGRSGWECVMAPQMEESGRLVISNNCATYHSFYIGSGLPCQHLELARGARFTSVGANYTRVHSDLSMTGEGTFEPLDNQTFSVGDGVTWTIDCIVSNVTAGGGFSVGRAGSSAYLILNRDNGFSGELSASSVAVSVPRLGRAGKPAPLGMSGAYTLSDTGSLTYTDTADETTDIQFNLSSASTFNHKGSGTLTFETPFSGSSTLTLSTASGATIALACSESTPLAFAADASVAVVKSATLSSVTFAGGANAVRVPDGVTATFTALDGSAAKSVDFRTTGTGTVIVPQVAGLTPSWMKLNGKAARITASGELMSLDADDRTVDARGGTIPDAPIETVAITTASGTAGVPMTLEADATSVLALRQRVTSEPVELALAAGQTLTAGLIEIVSGAQPLVVSGAGELSGAFLLKGGELVRTNATAGAAVALSADDAEEATVTLAGNLSEAKPLVYAQTSGDVDFTGSGAITSSTFTVNGGSLAISGDMTLTAPVRMAGLTEDPAAIYQSGGDIRCVSSGTDNVLFGYAGAGYYELSGGSMTALGQAVFGWNGQAVWSQTGGTYCQTNGILSIGGCISRTHFRLAGGTMLSAGAGNDAYLGTAGSNGGVGILTVEGADALFRIKTANANECRNFVIGPSDSSVASTNILNVRSGGKIRCGMIGGAKNRGSSSAAYVNADGGVVISEYLWDVPNFSGNSYYSAVDRVTLFEKGLTLQCGTPMIVSVPLSAPTGKGVSSVAWTDTDVKFIGSPFVQIVGDGQGATAYADFDSASQRVTGVHVTSPGWGYTTATAIVYCGRANGAHKVYAQLPCTLAENVSGGLTKTGSNSLTLKGTSTYTGATTVRQGSLVLGVDNAINAASGLVLDGGTLNVNGKAQTFSDITCNSGTISNGRPTVTGLVADFDAALTGSVKRVDISLAFDFAPGAAFAVKNLDASKLATAERRSYVLADFVNGIPTDVDFTKLTPPDGWVYRFAGNRLRLSKIGGLLILVK